VKPNKKDIEEWEDLCISLDKVRKKATHYARKSDIKNWHLLSQDPLMPEMRKWKI
jgi:hypothetical protein